MFCFNHCVHTPGVTCEVGRATLSTRSLVAAAGTSEIRGATRGTRPARPTPPAWLYSNTSTSPWHTQASASRKPPERLEVFVHLAKACAAACSPAVADRHARQGRGRRSAVRRHSQSCQRTVQNSHPIGAGTTQHHAGWHRPRAIPPSVYPCAKCLALTPHPRSQGCDGTLALLQALRTLESTAPGARRRRFRRAAAEGQGQWVGGLARAQEQLSQTQPDSRKAGTRCMQRKARAPKAVRLRRRGRGTPGGFARLFLLGGRSEDKGTRWAAPGV